MSSSTQYSFRPEFTSKIIQYLIWITCITSISAALLDGFFVNYLNIIGPQELLSLSWSGINHLYLWQFISYLFIQPPYGGINFNFILSLLFNMYLLWMIGSIVLERIGSTSFLKFYLLSGIFSGLCTLGIMSLLGSYAAIAGCSSAIYALLVVWTMLYPEAELQFFFLFPIKAKWLTAALLGVAALIGLSQFDFPSIMIIFSGAFYGYLYGVLTLDLYGPFAFSHRFEEFILNFKRKRFKPEQTPVSKIYDLQTGKAILSDDEFIDKMLDKIVKKGEKSLTSSEKQRMDKISLYKKHKK